MDEAKQKKSLLIMKRAESETAQSPSKMMQLAESNVLANMHKIQENEEDDREKITKDDFSLTMNKKPSKEPTKQDKLRQMQQKPECFKKIILDPEWKVMSMFTLLMVVFSMLSSLFAAYFACFGEPTSDSKTYYLDMVMEVCFLIDIFKNFFSQYTDESQPNKPVTDLFKIWQHYVKGPFFFDVLAISCWPLREIFRDSWSDDSVGLLYLLRIFRVSKILILMNLQRFTRMVRKRYRGKLVKIIEKNKDTTTDKTIDNNKIMQQIFLIKGFQVVQLVVFILILSYFLGTMWYIVSKHTTDDIDQFTFYNVYTLYEKENSESLSIVVYFMFTTLSTVGFGDFNPKSEVERTIMTFILLIGVACFSYIMAQFISILMDVQMVTAENEDSEAMQRWLLLLKNFNGNKPLPTEMTLKFERYFEYFWKNDKNYAMVSQDDKDIMDELPNHIQTSLYKDFLFQDYLDQFKVHFSFVKPEIQQDGSSCWPKQFDWPDMQYSEYMITLLSALEPRLFESGENIVEEGEEIDEQLYIISRDPRKPISQTGAYAIGFTLKDTTNKYFHVKLGPKTIICGYENMFDKRAEYTYKALMHVDAYGLRKSSFKALSDQEPEITKQMARYTLEYYHKIVRQPMLAFKKNILSQVSKRQEQDQIIRDMDQEIEDKEAMYQEDCELETFCDDDEDDNGKSQMKLKLGVKIQRIGKKVDKIYDAVKGIEMFS